jgi:hypothetical protein
MNAPDLLECAPHLPGLPGVHSIRWQNREAAHIVQIDWTGATEEEKDVIKAAIDRMIYDWPNRAFAVTLAGE